MVNFVIIDSLGINNTKLKIRGTSLRLTQIERVFLQFDQKLITFFNSIQRFLFIYLYFFSSQ